MSCQFAASREHIFNIDDFYFRELDGPFQISFYFKQSQLPHLFISSFCSILQYINMRTQRVSTLLRKRFTTPNWVKVSVL